MAAGENRQRARSDKAEARYRAAIEAMLANLIAAHLNAVDPERFLGVSFNRNDYVGMNACRDAMASCRDYLAISGLIEGQTGFNRWDADRVGTFGRRTRIRPTAKLRSMIDSMGAEHRALTIPDDKLIRVKRPALDLSPIPSDVEASRQIIKAINSRLANAAITVDDDLQSVVRSKYIEDEGEDTDDREQKRLYAGDMTATAIYRSFKGDWDHGGRLYGGWWMSLRRFLRPHIKIDGSPTVELDYKTLHPRLLCLKHGIRLQGDPYSIEDDCSKAVRDLGKRTFNRLLNKREGNPAKRLSIQAAKGDPAILPKGTSFKSYLYTLGFVDKGYPEFD